MTYHARLNWIMFGTIAGLLVFLYFIPQSNNIPEYSVSSHSIEAVRDLRIVRPQQEMILKQSNNQWYLIKPLRAFADEKKISEILQILKATSQQRFSLADLGRFGLAQPNMQLYVDDEYFGFGGFAPTVHQQYVATRDFVYLLSPRYALALPLHISDLISPQVLAPDEIPVKIELPHFAVEFQNNHWRMTLPHPGEALDEDTIKRWLQLWQTARADNILLVNELDSDFMETGRIKINLQHGQAIHLTILRNEFSIILLREKEGIGYRFVVDAGQQLLDPISLK